MRSSWVEQGLPVWMIIFGRSPTSPTMTYGSSPRRSRASGSNTLLDLASHRRRGDCPFDRRRWSSALSANLYREFIGHAAVGHLRLDQIMQGDEIVLDGVEESEAPTLAGTLRRAVDATNKTLTRHIHPTADVAQEEADGIARQINRGSRTS
jgi:hypothetical protein